MSGDSTIVDGRSGSTAKVDKNNRLNTAAVSKDAVVEASINGDTFFITTGTVNLTTDTESWLLYVKNEDTVQWVVDSIAAAFGVSTGGSGDSFNQFNVGATEGTLISAGVDLPAINLNIGSPKQLPSTIKLGGEGKTITNGINTPQTLEPEGLLSREFEAGPVVIPPGASFAIAYTPPAGNTSQNTSVQIVIFRELDNG
jgi:hypothetical protein